MSDSVESKIGEEIAGYRIESEGRTSRGIRRETIDDYRRDLGLGRDGELLGDGAVAFFGRLRLTAIEPGDIKRYALELAGRGLSPGSVRNTLAPVRALLATAVEEGLIRYNPATGVRVSPRVEAADANEPKAKALSEEEFAKLLEKVAPEWRLFVEFLIQTGLRIGEAVALRKADVDIGRRRLLVRRRLYRGRLDAPKSRYGRRSVPLTPGMAQALWPLLAKKEDDDPLFASKTGGMLDPSNLLERMFKPAAEAAGVPWASFHSCRHTCASILFNNLGLNAKQVQVWLGHHSPAFTLSTYVHLISDDLPDPEGLDELTKGATEEATRPTETSRDDRLAAEG